MAMASAQQHQRNCVSCGRTIDWDADICQYCGYDYRRKYQVTPAPKKNDKVLWIVVIVVLVVVLAPIILATVLYFMVLGFGAPSSTPGINVLQKSAFGSGYKIAFTAPTAEVTWTDVAIRLSVGMDMAVWTTMTTKALTSANPPAVWNGPTKTIGDLTVYLNITDLAGNGRMNNGDYITLQVGDGVFSPGSIYTLSVLYEPTDGSMLTYDFTG
jgi:predicted nucleic acid-binding Zn ribbon protein